MKNEQDTAEKREVSRRVSLLVGAIILFALAFWVPFGFLGLKSVSFDTPFSALLILICLPGAILLLRMALSVGRSSSDGTSFGDAEFDFSDDDGDDDGDDGGDDGGGDGD